MGILYFAAMLCWFIYLVLSLLAAIGLLWLATRLWRRAAVLASPARAGQRLRCLALAVGLVAWGPPIWVLRHPPGFLRASRSLVPANRTLNPG